MTQHGNRDLGPPGTSFVNHGPRTDELRLEWLNLDGKGPEYFPPGSQAGERTSEPRSAIGLRLKRRRPSCRAGSRAVVIQQSYSRLSPFPETELVHLASSRHSPPIFMSVQRVVHNAAARSQFESQAAVVTTRELSPGTLADDFHRFRRRPPGYPYKPAFRAHHSPSRPLRDRVAQMAR
jgi:hypothetical protein